MSKLGKIAVVVSSTVATASTQAAGLEATDFGSIQVDTIATLGVAAGIGIAIMVAGLGWDVGISAVKKFVKRGAK
ncbi:hypothetical protein [Methylomonas koyamae]|uniref:Methyltransferase n=1 Tax=Methylomonas koyamae TaxID=702114 RepID=A0A177NRX6_9GAMM|nr:hypothetical protein [Methylomonas koyamae]OAI19979.1 hypothetical protein A1355_03265 [Methylomonas koyamae]